MGLLEYVRAGVVLERNTVSTQTTSDLSGSISLGSAYALLSIEVTNPCRFRLYDNLNSVQSEGEISRTFDDISVSSSIGLVGDFSMSAAGIYSIDPVLYGVSSYSSQLAYYRIDGIINNEYPSVKLTKVLLENSSILSSSRVNFPIISANLAQGNLISGIISNATIPTTYLLVSASNTQNSYISRLRLYNMSTALSDVLEVSRSFSTESISNNLLVDMILSGSEITYFSPKIIGANIENMGTDLSTLLTNRNRIEGNNEIYYILQNISSSAGTVPISASIHVFSLEN
jgi:hypothetical protein